MASDPALAESLEQEKLQIEEAQRGHLNAMRPILENYAPQLYSTVILPRVGDPAAAEDLLRDTLAAAVQKIHSFRWQGRSIFFWLRQIAVNKVYDHHRRTKRSRALAEAVAAEAPVTTAGVTTPDIALIAAQERATNRGRIEDTLSKLSTRYRTAIQLRLIEERPREECAQTMNITVGTFDVVLFRAVRSFRKHFGGRDGKR